MEMDHTLYILQSYWWLLISVLGALLVFMLFVQGGQSMLLCTRDHTSQTLMVNLLGRKWELTFYHTCSIWRSLFRIIPIVLFNQFWRSLLAVDAYIVQLYNPGCKL